jgi:hypothetical protein
MLETLPPVVFLDILSRPGGWTLNEPEEERPEDMVVVTPLSVCKQWRRALLDSPAHAVQLLMRVPAVRKHPCACRVCDPSRPHPWSTCTAERFRRLQHKPLEYALVLAAALGADAAVQAMLSTMALQQTPGIIVRVCSGCALVAAAAKGHEATVRLLLAHTSSRAGSAFAHAASAGHEPIVRLLVKEWRAGAPLLSALQLESGLEAAAFDCYGEAGWSPRLKVMEVGGRAGRAPRVCPHARAQRCPGSNAVVVLPRRGHEHGCCTSTDGE